MADGSTLRVLAVFVSPLVNDEIAGSERSFVELGNALVELGAEVDTVEIPPSLSSVMKSRLNHYVLESGSGGSALLMHVFETLRIARNRRCEVVFAPVVYYPETLFIALLTHYILRKPLFVGMAGPFNEQYDRLGLAELIGRRLRGTCSTYTVMTSFLRRLSVRSAAGVLVPTGSLALFARDTLAARKTVVIRRGVDDSWFELGDSSIAKDYDAIFVGRLAKGKGLEVLLRAWVVVSTNLPGTRLLVVGSGPLRQRFERIVHETGLGDRVTFAGYVRDTNEIRKLMLASRILVLPSDEEGFARVASEAMACGVPCILSDIPGLRDIYGSAAVLVPRRDHLGLAEAI